MRSVALCAVCACALLFGDEINQPNRGFAGVTPMASTLSWLLKLQQDGALDAELPLLVGTVMGAQ